MIQEITRGAVTYVEGSVGDFETLIEKICENAMRKVVRDELIKNLPKPETKVLPWKTKKQIMLEMGIKSNTGFDAFRERELVRGNMKMKKAGRNNLYLITEK